MSDRFRHTFVPEWNAFIWKLCLSHKQLSWPRLGPNKVRGLGFFSTVFLAHLCYLKLKWADTAMLFAPYPLGAPTHLPLSRIFCQCRTYWLCWKWLASYLTPTFVTCSTNMPKDLVKLITCNDVSGSWVDMWRSGTFPLYSYIANPRNIAKTVWCQVLHSQCLQSVAHSLICGFLGISHSFTHPPHIQLCHCMWSVSPGLPQC